MISTLRMLISMNSKIAGQILQDFIFQKEISHSLGMNVILEHFYSLCNPNTDVDLNQKSLLRNLQ